jgi:hypothetical protein
MVTKQTLDKIRGYLITRGFIEGKTGVWLMGERPHTRLVDLNKNPFEYAITDGISRWTEGHGVADIEEVQQAIEGIVLLSELSEPKQNNPPQTVRHKNEKPVQKKENHIHIHIHIHLHVHCDDTNDTNTTVTTEVEK